MIGLILSARLDWRATGGWDRLLGRSLSRSEQSSLAGKRILVTGGHGFLGTHLLAEIAQYSVAELSAPTRREYDLTQPDEANRLFEEAAPALVFHLAAEVGGIGANQANPGRFFYANMAMGLNVIEAARQHEVEKFVQVGTVCAYPKHVNVPFRERDLWDG